MSKVTKLLVAIVVLLFPLSINIAKAEDYDFLFQVPVELRNLPPHPEISEASIQCFVWSKKLKEGEWFNPDVANGETRFKIDGNYNGIVEVKLKAKPGINPARAKTWRCVLKLSSVRYGFGPKLACKVLGPPYGPYLDLLDPSKPCRDIVWGYFE